MINAPYEKLIEKIAKISGVSVDEIDRRVEAKKAKLSDLISKEGAAQIVAAELGVTFDKQKVKINELLSGMRKLTVSGKIIRLFPVRTFRTKTTESKVATFILADDTAAIRCVLWDVNHIKLIEEGKFKEESIVELQNTAVRGTEIKELHLGSLSEIVESDETFEKIVTTENITKKKISDLKENDRTRILATVVQAFEPRFFPTCPECNIKINQEGEHFLCTTHGNVVPRYRAIFSMVADDGSNNMRIICFDENISKILNINQEEIEKLRDSEFFLSKKSELLGKDFSFLGRVRQNKFFDNLEFFVQDVQEAQPDDIIKELNKKEHTNKE